MSGTHDTDAEEERPDQRIHVGERTDGQPVSLPVERVLTGRAFLTGKSGSGKSNSASVVIEELLDRGFPVAIVDTDGEYYGLKEEYELLHAGADEECDIQVDVEHAEKLASLALEENVPFILDVSGYLDESVASELIRETARHLFAKEKKLKKPFLLVVEEIHEYVPEGGGMDDTGRMLVKVGKRGRKHGLGIVGISQRPADVKKDFITQANWLVWHRLTWNNDTKVVKRIVGSEYGEAVSNLDAGEAFVQADWTEADVQRVQWRRKRTFDAGATPGLDDFERPELKSVSDGLMDDLSDITDRKEREQDRIEELEDELARKNERIEELEREVERAQNVSSAAEQMASAVAEDLSPETYQARLGAKNDEIDRLHDRIAGLERRMETLDGGEESAPASLEAFEAASPADAPDAADVPDAADGPDGDPDGETAESVPGSGVAEADPDEVAAAVAAAAAEEAAERVRPDEQSTAPERDATADGADEFGDEARYFSEDGTDPRRTDGPAGPFSEYESIESYLDTVHDRDGETPHVDRAGGRFRPQSRRSDHGTGSSDAGGRDAEGAEEAAPTAEPPDEEGDDGEGGDPVADLLRSGPVAVKLRAAIRGARCNEEFARRVVAALAADGPLSFEDAAEEADVPPENAYSLLSALRARSLVTRDAEHRYALNRSGMAETVATAGDGPHHELQGQWNVE
jgi:hypothetical protein